jgi:hypothetical protein
MRSTTRLAVSCPAAVLALWATSIPAIAAPKPITGKLSEPGYTVIALSAKGTGANSVRVRHGRFKLSPPSRLVTLHLRGSDGKYAGSIVVAGGGDQVVVGVKAGASLGTIAVLDGYAKVAGRPSAHSIERRRVARARNGVPKGVGNYGRVRSRPTRASGAGADRDRDGLPGALDIDDDGDLILDNLERLRRARGAQSEDSAATFYLASTLKVPLEETLGEDGPPREPALEGLERKLLEQSALVEHGKAPLLVVVALKQRVAVAPATRSCHHAKTRPSECSAT